MTNTDSTKTPAKGVLHAHGLTATDAALAGKAAIAHTHPTYALASDLAALTARVKTLEDAQAPVVRTFTPTGTSAEFVALLTDNTVDVIQLSGTYNLPYAVVNINRTRPVTVKGPATFSGAAASPNPQWSFGFGGRAGSINFANITFDGYVLGAQGIIQILDAHDMALTDVTVRNCRTNGTTGSPFKSMGGLPRASGNPVHPVNITLDRWNVAVGGRQMSALQVYGGRIRPCHGVDR